MSVQSRFDRAQTAVLERVYRGLSGAVAARAAVAAAHAVSLRPEGERFKGHAVGGFGVFWRHGGVLDA